MIDPLDLRVHALEEEVAELKKLVATLTVRLDALCCAEGRDPCSCEICELWRRVSAMESAGPPDARGWDAVPQQVHERGWQWRPAEGGGAFAPPFGTIRVCRHCGCLVAGGPTVCGRCARA